MALLFIKNNKLSKKRWRMFGSFHVTGLQKLSARAKTGAWIHYLSDQAASWIILTFHFLVSGLLNMGVFDGEAVS